MIYLADVDFDYLDSMNISIKDDSYIDSVVLLELPGKTVLGFTMLLLPINNTYR